MRDTTYNLPPGLPATIAGRYLPLRLIARGGMGAVYEVEHVRTGERLALKVLHSRLRVGPGAGPGVGSSREELQRFKREARTAARIKSEHVVRVVDADVAPELDDAPFLVMELLDGADLEHAAAASPPTPTTVVEWLRQVARALDKAHALGIVHRDVKPENLFLARVEDGRAVVKILDFGIVKMAGDSTGPTASGQLLGTPKYMAPEQASTSAPVTAAADRFALGLVAYRLLTGGSYYRGDVMTILAQLLHEPLAAPSHRHPGLAAAFDAWFQKACHRDPDQRFTSAAEQIEALSDALGLPTLPVAPSPVLAPARGPTRSDRRDQRGRRRVLSPLVAAVVLLLGLATTFLLWRSRLPGPQPKEPVALPSAPPMSAPRRPSPPPPAEAPAPWPSPATPAAPTSRPDPGPFARTTRSKHDLASTRVTARESRPRTTQAPPPSPTRAPSPPALDPYAEQK